MEYKIIEAKEDPKESIIEKTGHKIHFSMYEIESTRSRNEKVKKEIKGQCEIENAKMKNYIEHHPIINGMSHEDIAAVAMYWESLQYVSKAEKKLKEFEEHEIELEKEITDIETQIPELKLVPTPYGEENNPTESTGE